MKLKLHALEEKFSLHCRENRFFSSGDRVLLAVSGGKDSVVLCHLMNILKDQLNFKIAIAHVNHGLRGRAADRDASFVKRYADRLGCPFFQEKVDVKSETAGTKRSIEEVARTMRYAFFENVAGLHGFNKICTAHHLGDQAETILMRIIKGAGWSGMTGIRQKRGLYIRPMLIFSRDEIASYVLENHIPFVEDKSNLDRAFLRNRIRHELIPLLKSRFDPQIEKHLVQIGVIAGETKELISKDAKKHFSAVCTVANGKILLEIKAFNRYLRAQRHALIEMLFSEFFGLRLQYTDYQNLYDLIEKRQSGKRILIENIICIRSSSKVIFEIERKHKRTQFHFDIDQDGSYKFADTGWVFSSETLPYSPKIKKELGRNRNIEFIDAGKISGKLVLRNWRTGDKFVPLGMERFKRISDFFIDEKTSIGEKKKIPILCERKKNKETVIWICGMRIDNRYKIDNSTHHILKMKCERNEKDH